MGDEERGPMAFKKKPEVLKPVKVEVRAEIPVRLPTEQVKRVGTEMATTMADPLYAMLLAARKQGVEGLELQRMANV